MAKSEPRRFSHFIPKKAVGSTEWDFSLAELTADISVRPARKTAR